MLRYETAGGVLRNKRNTWDSIRAELIDRQANDVAWVDGRLQGLNHYAGDDVLSVAMKAYELYASTNPVSARAFPSVIELQNDIIQTSIGLLGGSSGSAGTVTSGGTESIFLALKSARDIAQQQRGIALPEIVLPSTAHPAFDKHAHYLGMKTIRVPVGGDYRADVEGMGSAVSANTIMVVGSAPCYPYGLFDPISALANLAKDSGLLMHVDACVGGYQAPFARELGYDIPEFDLSVPGVTSISADLHKYGFSLKGASVVLFQTDDLKQASKFEFDNWPRGRYQTDTFAGTRSGGPVAAAWAVMRYLGAEGYLEVTKQLMQMRDHALSRIAQSSSLQLVGKPELSLLAFSVPGHDISALSEKMLSYGWILNLINEPASLQIMINMSHRGHVDEFFDDLMTCMASPGSHINKSISDRGVTAEY